jgi:hypothetical protein
LRFCGPFFLVLGFVAKTIYNVGFAWWLDPWLETKAQQALLKDVRAHLGFLFDEYGVELVSAEQEWPTIPYPAVTVHVLSLSLRLSDMRGDLHVEVAPDKCQTDLKNFRQCSRGGPLRMETRHRTGLMVRGTR